MIENQLELLRDHQKESWNRFSSVWKRSDDLLTEFLRPVSDEIIHLLKPYGTDVILDVASGCGEPGLTIASRLNGGMVIITDLAEAMLAIARENAARKRIGNIDTWACDACDLPFADNTFDAISCRLGFMFFRDIPLAVRQIARVLKPGGRIATAVWNVSEKNRWLTATTPPSGSPDMFCCAQEGLIADLFQRAGLTNIRVTEVPLSIQCPSTEVYGHIMTEVGAPGFIHEAVQQPFPEGHIAIDGSVLVIYGEKR